jgi:hypothetical protein
MAVISYDNIFYSWVLEPVKKILVNEFVAATGASDLRIYISPKILYTQPFSIRIWGDSAEAVDYNQSEWVRKYNLTIILYFIHKNSDGDERFYKQFYADIEKVCQILFDNGRGISTSLPSDVGLYLDGTDDYVDFGDVNDYEFSGDYSFAIWFKTDNVSENDGFLMSKGRSSSANDYWRMGIQNKDDGTNPNKLIVTTKIDGRTAIQVISSAAVNDGDWHHAVVTGDRDGLLSLYLDGNTTPQATADISGDTGAYDSAGTKDFLIGSFSGNLLGDYAQSIDEAAIWNAVLSSADVASIYNGGNPNNLTLASSYDSDKTSNLIGYWRFDEGSGSPQDSSGEGHHGTLVGNATYGPGAGEGTTNNFYDGKVESFIINDLDEGEEEIDGLNSCKIEYNVTLSRES